MCPVDGDGSAGWYWQPEVGSPKFLASFTLVDVIILNGFEWKCGKTLKYKIPLHMMKVGGLAVTTIPACRDT